jgi:hypothetical protein
MEELRINIDSFRCPLSKLIYREPVTLADGYTYEKDKIEEHLKTNNNSPVTGEEFQTKLFVTNRHMASIVSEFVLRNAEMKKIQYIPPNPNYETIIKFDNYEELFDFDSFDAKLFMKFLRTLTEIVVATPTTNAKRTKIIDFFWKNEKLMKYIINNLSDLEEVDPENQCKFIDFLCCYSDLEIIKHLMSKNVALNNLSGHGTSAVHYAGKFNNREIIEYLLENGCDVSLQTSKNETLIDCIIANPNIKGDDFNKLVNSLLKLGLTYVIKGTSIEIKSNAAGKVIFTR